MNVEELWRYPVKSVGGERLEHAQVTEHGLAGDRRWGIRDNETGMILTARREPKLLMATASLTETGSVRLQLPDGSSTADDATLSVWLDRGVSLVAAGTGEATYESPRSAENEDEWYAWSGPGTALHDEPYARVSIVSKQSLGDWDVRRIRPNIVVGGGGETELVGMTISAGSAIVEVVDVIPRCVMVTRPQPGLPRDLEVLKSINRNFGSRLAIGGLVVEPGEIAVGDAVASLRRRDARPSRIQVR